MSLAIIECPGLTRRLMAHAPKLTALGQAHNLPPVFPALTLPAHGALLTGQPPERHGLVANGWYDRAHDQVFMWRQSEGLLDAPPLWETARQQRPDYSCLKHFWWPGMASTADTTVNVRPVYFADGRKSGGVYSNQQGLAAELESRFGQFPLFQFWGPAADIRSTQWICDTAAWLATERAPADLNLIYLPHLDYKQQTLGPNHPDIAKEVRELDDAASELVASLQAAGIDCVVCSSYGMNEVSQPIHLNRLFREKGWLKTVRNAAGELIDFAESDVFAVSDHQIANVYVRNEAMRTEVRGFLEELDGVDSVQVGRHEREGEFLLTAEKHAWFTYYYWLDDALAPDFARTVAIHAKPGYDPCEMLIDPTIAFAKAKVISKVLRKKLGFRMLMDVIPLDANLIKGSHGRLPESDEEMPVWISTRSDLPAPASFLDVHAWALTHG